MSSALVLQTQDNCPPGLLGDWARAREVELDIVRVDRWTQLPSPREYSFAVLLGSDASLAEPPRGWVAGEIEWAGRADALGVPLLGICFGAQVLAAALGGSITRLPAPEHAWIEVESEQIPSGPWLALHEDGITLPSAAHEIARNERGTQAFSIGRHVGVQFHPEATASILSGWVADKAGLVSTELLVGVAERCRRAAAGAFTLFDAFLARAQASAALAHPGGGR